MTQETIEKRNMLRTISNAAIQAAETMNLNPDEYRVNDLIMHFIYNPDKDHIFDSFLGWKLKGHTVKKGVKAFLLWGQPINRTRINKATGEITQGGDDEKDPPYFPLAYLFRDDQVMKPEPRKPKEEKQIKEQIQTTDIDI